MSKLYPVYTPDMVADKLRTEAAGKTWEPPTVNMSEIRPPSWDEMTVNVEELIDVPDPLDEELQ